MKVAGIPEDPKRGKRIKDLRELEARLTQEELGDLVGVSKFAVGKWEQGKSMMPSHLAALARELGKTREHILTGEESELGEPVEDRLDELERRGSRLDADLSRRLDQQQEQLDAIQALVEVLAAGSKTPLPAEMRQLLRDAPRRGSGPSTH